MFQVDTMVLIIMVVLVTYQVHANPSISTSTPTPCYGDVVTLVCYHPGVVSNHSRYFTTTPSWRENGNTIDILDGTIYTVDPVDLTSTFLTINITVDYVRDKSFKYSCLLTLVDEKGDASGSERSEEVTVDPVVLAGETKFQTGGVETSNEITVDPVDQLPTPMNTATFSNSTTAVLTVSFDPQCCNTAQLNVDITTTSSSATTPVVHFVDSTDPTNTTIVITDITEGVSYTAGIQSVCEDNNLLEDSGVLVVEIMAYNLTLFNSTSSTTTDADSNSTAYPNTNLFYLLILLIVFVLFIIGGVAVGVVCLRMAKATNNESAECESTHDEKPTSHVYINVEPNDNNVPLTPNPAYVHVAYVSNPHYENL